MSSSISSSTSGASSSTARPYSSSNPPPPRSPGHGQNNSRIPVTPAMLRSIFASSRTPNEERSISRVAFFRFAGFLMSCLGISLLAGRNRGVGMGVRGGAGALLGVV